MLRLALSTCLLLALAFAACGGDDDTPEPSTNYPAAGEDRFEQTRATVEIEVTPPTAARPGAVLTGALQTIELVGPALIMRSDPELDGDVYVVRTEIVEMELRGTSSFGPVIVRESADRDSTGEVRQQEVGQDFPADSFFDVFVEVELPDLDLTLHNEEPMRMSTTLRGLPPEEGEAYRGEDERPLYTPAGLEVGRIVDALHIPEPEAEEATEEPEETEEAATSTPTEPSAEATPEPTEPESAISTSGACTHRQTQSMLHIEVAGLQPGQTVSGTVTQSPPDGLISPAAFTAVAGGDGVARVDLDIARIGEYAWEVDGVSGSYTVGQTCPGPQ
jgi:hypothetical protein